MSNKHPRLDQAFLDRQRQRLTQLRSQIRSVRATQTREEAGANAEVSEQAYEQEDDAQRLTTLELEDNLAAVDDQRLRNVERALQKLDEGTYGLSDRSGTPIPIQRLEAAPEAIYTVEEQNSQDARR